MKLIPLASISLLLLFSCNPDSKEQEPRSKPEVKSADPDTRTELENDLIQDVEHFLFMAGNYNIKGIKPLIIEHANIGRVALEDGKWNSSSMTFEEYFVRVEGEEHEPFLETVGDYQFQISDGQLASVRADAILYRYGVPNSQNVDHFTFIKQGGYWKILSVSYTKKMIPEEEREFDLEAFASGYAQAWCSGKPEYVSYFFEENGVLGVNENDPAEGRGAIQEVARSFMLDLPDMLVRLDSIVEIDEKPRFHWTLLGTYAETGSMVDVKGYEEWELGPNNLIQRSQGHFPTEEYEKQRSKIEEK